MYSIVLMMALGSGAEAPAFHSCNGCHASWNSCHCRQRHHRSHGCHGRSHGCSGHHGCHAYHGCHSYHHASACCGCHGYDYGYASPMSQPMPPPPPPEGERLKSPPKPSTEEAYGTSRTTIFVSLPANAKLLIDGHATVSTSANRVFASPALEMGKDYYYTLEGELVRDGQIITASKTITFRAGQEVQVELEFPTTTVIER